MHENIYSIIIRELKKEATREWSTAAEHFNALTDYLWTRTDILEEVSTALFTIQEAMDRIGRDL